MGLCLSLTWAVSSPTPGGAAGFQLTLSCPAVATSLLELFLFTKSLVSAPCKGEVKHTIKVQLCCLRGRPTPVDSFPGGDRPFLQWPLVLCFIYELFVCLL